MRNLNKFTKSKVNAELYAQETYGAGFDRWGNPYQVDKVWTYGPKDPAYQTVSTLWDSSKCIHSDQISDYYDVLDAMDSGRMKRVVARHRDECGLYSLLVGGKFDNGCFIVYLPG